MTLDKKIDFAIKLLRSIPQDGPIELCYSGGKDSDVILQLAKESGIPFEAIYKNTTIDPPGTIAHCRENGVTIMQPKVSMFQLVERRGWPTRWARFCCETLKEYSIHRRAIQGIRRDESTKRAERYKEPEFCRTYGKDDKVRVYLPILEWTKEDITTFIADRGIKCHPLYYDEAGNFHPERRLGCIGCPLAADNGKAEFKQYPKMLRAWIKAADRFLKGHPNTKSAEHFPDAYHLAAFKLFFSNLDDYEKAVNSPLFPEMAVDCKAYLENYFKIDLTI